MRPLSLDTATPGSIPQLDTSGYSLRQASNRGFDFTDGTGAFAMNPPNPQMPSGTYFSGAGFRDPAPGSATYFAQNVNGGRAEPSPFYGTGGTTGTTGTVPSTGFGFTGTTTGTQSQWGVASAPQQQMGSLGQVAPAYNGGYSAGLLTPQAPSLGLNAFGTNMQGQGYSYVGTAGPVGVSPLSQGNMATQQQAHALGGWAAKPQLTFGFTGQQQPAPTSWANNGNNAFRPTQGLGGAPFGLASAAPAPPIAGFGFTGPAQHPLTTPLHSNASATPFAGSLFGNPSLASTANHSMAFSTTGVTPLSHQHPFEPSRGFAWNVKSFEQGVTGLSNYETPVSSSWMPQTRAYPNGYGLSNWGRWNGVSPDYNFNRPADVGRSLLGQWGQPSTLFRHSVAPQAQAGLLTRNSTSAFSDPGSNLWGGGLPLGYLGYTHAGIYGYHSLDRQARALQERCRMLGLVFEGRPSLDDPLLHPVVYRKATAEEEAAKREEQGEGEEAAPDEQEAGIGEDQEPELHRTIDPYAHEVKTLRLALATC